MLPDATRIVKFAGKEMRFQIKNHIKHATFWREHDTARWVKEQGALPLLEAADSGKRFSQNVQQCVE